MVNRKSAIQSIDVRDLSEPAVAVLLSMAQVLRRESAKSRHTKPKAASDGLVRTIGRLKGEITRAEIYRDVG